MRSILTFVLRLLVDDEHPEDLRGALQIVGETENLPFSDEQMLLCLLHEQSTASRLARDDDTLPEKPQSLR